jgi:hypothetical protein
MSKAGFYLHQREPATLTDVSYTFVSLTDGSWRSILQGLLKLPRLETLSLRYINQKQAHTPTNHPVYKGAPAFPKRVSHPLYDGRRILTIKRNSNIRRFLKSMLQNFRFQSYKRKADMARIGIVAPKITRAKYYEVILYHFWAFRRTTRA